MSEAAEYVGGAGSVDDASSTVVSQQQLEQALGVVRQVAAHVTWF